MPLFALLVSLFGYFDGFKTRPKLITENPSWQLAGIYADDGISGTDMKKKR